MTFRKKNMRNSTKAIIIGAGITLAGLIGGEATKPTESERNQPVVQNYIAAWKNSDRAKMKWLALPDSEKEFYTPQYKRSEYSVAQAHSEIERVWQERNCAEMDLKRAEQPTEVREFQHKNTNSALSYIGAALGVILAGLGFKNRFFR